MHHVNRTVLLCGLLLAMVPPSQSAEDPKTNADVDTRPFSKEAEVNAARKAGTLWNGNGVEIPFRWCPAGTFLMGSPEDEWNGSTLEQVSVTHTKGFWMGQHEVTQAEWRKVMSSTIHDQHKKIPPRFERDSPFEPPTRRVADDPATFGEGKDYPMYYVNWDEALHFCQTLTEAERAAGRLPSNWEYTLPTEAQWEYACRAGTETATGLGDTLSSYQANFDGRRPYTNFKDEDVGEEAPMGPNRRRTLPVGCFRPNAWILYDMHGNVSEWCRDWYDEKHPPKGNDPEVTDDTKLKCVRGGDWLGVGWCCLSSFRWHAHPNGRNPHRGFRIVLRQLR